MRAGAGAGAWIAVAAGGALGAALRAGVDLLVPSDGFPLSTLLVNTAGSFALGLATALLWSRVPAWLRAGLGAGLLGGFTTFSAVMTQALQATAYGWLPPLAVLAANATLSVGAAWAGLAAGRRGGGRRFADGEDA